jgi:putative addiction module component (TIGR02574 family)
MASPNLAEILDFVRDLSPRDNLGLVSELVNDLEGSEDEGWANAWREELDRRLNDPTERTGAAGDEVIARARRALVRP